MAENAPLTGARTHASNAAKETQQVHWDEAVDEHNHAAAEYARAAKTTGDSEALRVLKLLEAQHQKLARIIKSRDEIPPSEPVLVGQTTSNTTEAKDATAPPDQATGGKTTPKRTSTTSALAAAHLSARTRDASPSLARDIASRRGIPQPTTAKQTLSPAAQARARQSSPATHRQPTTPKPQIPPSIMTTSQSALPSKPSSSSTNDDAFNTFYSSLTTGTMSKLSSALAFAGLALNPSETPRQQLPPSKPRTRTVPASNDPDMKAHFSAAALRAIEAEHRAQNPNHPLFGPAESFYVVQSSGGTTSYADMAKGDKRRQQQGLGGDDEDEDAFVDAREAQLQSSSTSNGEKSRRTGFGKNRTAEELELENTTLKSTLESLASRLANFEAHAQDASMAALTQSMASLHSHAQYPPPASRGDDHERVRVLEEQIRDDAEKRERLELLAQKQERKIRLYHEKWEGLKKGARDKERAKREAAGAGEGGSKEGGERNGGGGG